MADQNQQRLTHEEAAAYLRIRRSTLYKWVFEKKIAYVKVGSKLIFLKSDLDDYLSRNRIASNFEIEEIAASM